MSKNDKSKPNIKDDWEEILATCNSEDVNGKEYAAGLIHELLSMVSEDCEADIAQADKNNDEEKLKKSKDLYNRVNKSDSYIQQLINRQ